MIGFFNILAQMSNLTGRDTTRFFGQDRRQEALEWLLRDD